MYTLIYLILMTWVHLTSFPLFRFSWLVLIIAVLADIAVRQRKRIEHLEDLFGVDRYQYTPSQKVKTSWEYKKEV